MSLFTELQADSPIHHYRMDDAGSPPDATLSDDGSNPLSRNVTSDQGTQAGSLDLNDTNAARRFGVGSFGLFSALPTFAHLTSGFMLHRPEAAGLISMMWYENTANGDLITWQAEADGKISLVYQPLGVNTGSVTTSGAHLSQDTPHALGYSIGAGVSIYVDGVPVPVTPNLPTIPAGGVSFCFINGSFDGIPEGHEATLDEAAFFGSDISDSRHETSAREAGYLASTLLRNRTVRGSARRRLQGFF